MLISFRLALSLSSPMSRSGVSRPAWGHLLRLPLMEGHYRFSLAVSPPSILPPLLFLHHSLLPTFHTSRKTALPQLVQLVPPCCGDAVGLSSRQVLVVPLSASRSLPSTLHPTHSDASRQRNDGLHPRRDWWQCRPNEWPSRLGFRLARSTMPNVNPTYEGGGATPTVEFYRSILRGVLLPSGNSRQPPRVSTRTPTPTSCLLASCSSRPTSPRVGCPTCVRGLTLDDSASSLGSRSEHRDPSP